MTTPAQQQDKVQNAQINTQAIAPVTLTPNQGSVVPNVWQQNYVQDSIGDNPTITPPSEENIHKNMFIGSGMVGLMAALATGNPAAGLVAGMWGAVAIHDHGYDLRQRSKQVNKLQAEGYSFPAILDWYKTGSNKELDKEHTQMEEDRRADNRTVNETNRFNAQQETARTNHTDQMNQERLSREQSQRNADRAYGAQQDAANRADARMDKQLESQSWQEVKPAVANSQSKQIQLGMAEKDLQNMDAAEKAHDKNAMAAAYNNYREHMGRAIIGGTGMLDSDEVTKNTGLPDLADAAWNKGVLNFTGMPSTDQMKAYHAQTKYDVENETSALQQLATNQYEALVAGGVSPDKANQRVNRMFGGTSIGTNDYSKTPATQTPAPSQEKPSDSQVDSVMAKYGHTKK